MIHVDFDQGKFPSVLAALQDQKLAALAAKTAAESYTDSILDYIAEGKSFTARSPGDGLEQSIGWRPEGDGAVVYANAEHAQYIERGTGLHGPYKKSYLIQPIAGGGRKALKIPIAGGGHMFRRVVNHPGIQARPFFFADYDAREEKMLDAVSSVIARKLGTGAA
jgi:hypothetical protein